VFKEKRTKLQSLDHDELTRVSEILCHESIEAFPIFECIKVFAKLTKSNTLTFVRHPNDLGIEHISAQDIASRMKNEQRSKIVCSALDDFSTAAIDIWPFAPGSSSWLQLEILHPEIRHKGPINRPSIVVRKACRLSSLKSQPLISTSPLLERMFRSFVKSCPATAGSFEILARPSFFLKNIAGTGVITESKELLAEGSISQLDVADYICQNLIKNNNSELAKLSPGFFVKIEKESYHIVTTSYSSKLTSENKPKKLPLLTAGWVK
jgi:hypothetical protein